MKLTTATLAAMLLGMTALTVGAADTMPGVPAQSDAYWAERALSNAETLKARNAGNGAQAAAQSDALYTGKPYDADSGTYAFMFRNYDPELGRWTAADPMGFPDGPNGQFYAPVPTSSTDSLGLLIDPSREDGEFYAAFVFDWEAWNQGVSAFAATGFELSRTGMNHADGTNGGNWTLNSEQKEIVKGTSEYTTYIDGVQQAFQTNFTGIYSTGSQSWSTQQENVHFAHGTDPYYGFGDARFSTTGTVTISQNMNVYTADYYATVTLNDVYTFAAHPNAFGLSPTGAGFRLETHGWIDSFSTTGTWEHTFTFTYE